MASCWSWLFALKALLRYMNNENAGASSKPLLSKRRSEVTGMDHYHSKLENHDARITMSSANQKDVWDTFSAGFGFDLHDVTFAICRPPNPLLKTMKTSY